MANYKSRLYFLFIVFFSVFFLTNSRLEAQSVLNGTIKDSKTRAPLAFVSVVIEGTNNGTLSDIDGKFSLQIPSENEKGRLVFQYLGYATRVMAIDKLREKDNITIELLSTDFVLEAVKVQAKENPAHRIIRNVTANREKNNPEKMRSFAYVSYNKMFVTADMKAVADTNRTMDTTKKKEKDNIVNTLKKQHLFLTESVSERKYLHPGRNNEKVLASRVSGFKNSPFTMLATQMQSFSFYDDFITVFDKHYVNPVCKGSTSKYFFKIQDTLYQGKDTVFIIAYRPYKGKNFDGLKGSLYINTNGWAIQNVIAQPAERKGGVSIKIQQKYELIENTQWFPVQLNTDWIYMNTVLSDSTMYIGMGGGKTEEEDEGKMNSNDGKVKAIGRTYISEIRLNPEVKRKQFNEVELEMTTEADKRDDAFWSKYRVDSLTEKDKMTYHKVDSFGKAENLDKKLLFYEALGTGKLNWKYIDFDLNRIINANRYEGFRPGIGIHTSNRLSKRFNAGGYFAYGFRDKTIKYGGDINLLVWRKKELNLHLSYQNDVVEAGNVKFFENRVNVLSSELYRDYYILKMDRYKKYEASADFRLFKYFRTSVYAHHMDRWSERGFLVKDADGLATELDTFGINEAGLQVKFIFREKFMQTPRAKISLGSDFPVVFLNVSKAMKNEMAGFAGDVDFTKMDVRIDHGFRFRTIGRLNFSLQAGHVIGNTPYAYLGVAKGSRLKGFSVSTMNTFETMDFNEFASSTYASLFLNHNIGKFLKKRKKFNPQLELVHNMGWGLLENKESNTGIGIKTLEKGYFESGLRLNNLYKSGLSGFGASVHYRYGPYARAGVKDNIYARLTLGVSF